jgi:hypothetical protein
MSDYRTQNRRILDRLLGYGRGLTSLEASRMDPPIMRLSERIRELEADHAVFMRTQERVQGCAGKYTRYWLKSLENYQGGTVDRAQEQYMGADDFWSDAKHDAELARL